MNYEYKFDKLILIEVSKLGINRCDGLAVI